MHEAFLDQYFKEHPEETDRRSMPRRGGNIRAD